MDKASNGSILVAETIANFVRCPGLKAVNLVLNVMTTEVELKLAVPSRALRNAAGLPWLKKLAVRPPTRKKLVSVYFDTPKFKLRNNGVTLRIRRAGDKRLQTIKLESNGVASVLGRGEWEEEVGDDKPNLKLARGTVLEPLVTSKLRKSLRPIFETEVQRIAMPLRLGGSELELAFDQGQITTGKRKEPISEIEIELKKGDRTDLAKLSERLAKEVSATYGAQTKPARGYALSADEQNEPVYGSKIVFRDDASTGDAFAVIGFSCLHHLAANERSLRHEMSEGVHQMRVAVRRLRAAISLFKDLVESEETEKVKRELKWLTEQLGPARDLDVLVQEEVRPLRKSKPGMPEIAALEGDLVEKRAAGLQRAKAAVASERYRLLLLDVALWLINSQWSMTKDSMIVARRNRPVVDFAQEMLDSRTAKIGSKVKKLERLSAERRHKLRIAVKKLRYGTDFFASLLTKSKQKKKARKSFENALKRLQDALGKLNDITVHEGLARQFTRPGKRSTKSPQKAFAMGLLAGREVNEAHECTVAAIKAGRALVKVPSFW